MAFKLKIVGTVPSANNSITQWHFLVEGTGIRIRDWVEWGGGFTWTTAALSNYYSLKG